MNTSLPAATGAVEIVFQASRIGAVNSSTESFIDDNVVLSSPNQLVLVVDTAPDTVLAAVAMVLPPAEVTAPTPVAPATELMGADPNTSLRPPLAINDPAAVITMEVMAPLHAMLLSCDHVKTAQSNYCTSAQIVTNSGRWLAID
jgi:hypothetical protein